MPTQQFNVGDRLTPARFELNERDTSNTDLSADTVSFSMFEAATGTVKVDDQAATLTNGGTDGKAHYDWAAADLDTAGTFFAYWKRTSGGLDAQYPQNGPTLVIVVHATPP